MTLTGVATACGNAVTHVQASYGLIYILDKHGHLPLSASGGALLFHLLSKLYKRTSLAIPTNLSFSEWGD
ncbi:MAG: hypothetical protein CGW95_06330 [Phenylobacterium zucineum]|nr:MAG: hypothetical protein CGW95_06330 [Phenylobacterium zucineum]